MDWLRLHHDTINDPKWRVVAARSGQPLHAVLAVWMAMLVNASRSPERGTLDGWDDEDMGVAVGLAEDSVTAIRNAMQGKVLDGGRLTGWEKRQPKREDGSAERAKAHRERSRTQPNATERERPLDKIREEKKEDTSEANASSVPPCPPQEDTAENHFETWWQEFPRYRRGPKGPARKKWLGLVKRRKATPDELLAGLERYNAAGYRDSEFAAGAERWLNAEYWTVEHFPPPGDTRAPPDKRAAANESEELLAELENTRNGHDRKPELGRAPADGRAAGGASVACLPEPAGGHAGRERGAEDETADFLDRAWAGGRS